MPDINFIIYMRVCDYSHNVKQESYLHENVTLVLNE